MQENGKIMSKQEKKQEFSDVFHEETRFAVLQITILIDIKLVQLNFLAF